MRIDEWKKRRVSKNLQREHGVAIIRQLVQLPASPGFALCFTLIHLILTIKNTLFPCREEERRMQFNHQWQLYLSLTSHHQTSLFHYLLYDIKYIKPTKPQKNERKCSAFLSLLDALYISCLHAICIYTLFMMVWIGLFMFSLCVQVYAHTQSQSMCIQQHCSLLFLFVSQADVLQ